MEDRGLEVLWGPPKDLSKISIALLGMPPLRLAQLATPPALATMVSKSGQDMWLFLEDPTMDPTGWADMAWPDPVTGNDTSPAPDSVLLLRSGLRESFAPALPEALLTLPALPEVSDPVSE